MPSAPDGGELLAPPASGIAVGTDVWIALDHEPHMHDVRTSYLVRIDASGNETTFALPGCLMAGHLAEWSAKDDLVVPCLGASDPAIGPLGNGEVLLFDIASGQVIRTWTGGAPYQAAVAGDTALVTDLDGTGVISIDLATGQVIRGVDDEANLCAKHQVSGLTATGQDQAGVAILSCSSNLPELHVIDSAGVGQSLYATEAANPGDLSLFATAPETFVMIGGPGLGTPIGFFSPPSTWTQIDIGSLDSISVADRSIFALVFASAGKEAVVQARDKGAGMQVQRSLPLADTPIGIFATTSKDVWVMFGDHFEHVRFP